MTKLLLGVFLGLLVVINSSPIDTMTQIPGGTEEDVIEEAMTDGFLVEQFFTTEPPKINTTVQASQEPPLAGSGDGSSSNAPQTVSPDMPSTNEATQQPYLATPTEGSGSTPSSLTEMPEMFTTVQASLQRLLSEGSGSGMTTSPPEVTPMIFPFTQSTLDNSVTQTTLQTNTDFSQEDGAESLGDLIYSSTSTTGIPTSTMSSVQSTTTQEPQRSINRGKERSLIDIVNNHNTFPSDEDSINGIQLPQESENMENGGMHKGHSTPDWIIILAFLVSLAALIALCAAIATRDKWNGPDQISVRKTNDSNQKKELEMQTFCHTEEPMENGKETEYTVVPLDDLDECSAE